MTKISKKTAYPLKNPVVGDYFVGTDSQNGNKTVSFGFENAANLLTKLMGVLVINYIFKTSENISFDVLTGGVFLSEGNELTIDSITKLYINKDNLNEDDLTDLFLFIKDNSSEFFIQLKNSNNLNAPVFFNITSVVNNTSHFIFNVNIHKSNDLQPSLIPFDNYFFGFDIKQNITKTSELTNDGADGVNPFITAEDLPEPEDISGKEDKINKGQANGYAPLNEFVKIASTYLNIVNDLVTGGATSLLSAEQGKQVQLQIDIINGILFSDNVNLDTVQEIVDAIESLQGYLDTILVNDLTTGGTTKALTAEMGKTLKGLIDALTLVVSDLQADVTNIDARVTVLENFTPPPTTGLTGQAFAVWSGTGLKYYGSWPNYYIEGVLIASGNDEVTLDPTDTMGSLEKRYDLIILDANGLNKITGTPDENPVLPTIDENTQIIISNVLLNAGDTIPSDNTVVREQIYDENVEWIVSKEGAVNINPNYTILKFKGTKSLQVTQFGSGTERINFSYLGTKSLLDYVILTFRIYLPSNSGSKASFDIFFQQDGVLSTVEKPFVHGLYGYSDIVKNTWQLITIPLSVLEIRQINFNRIVFRRSSGDINFFIDDVALVGANMISNPTKQKAITTITTDDGVASSTKEDDTFTMKGFGGILVSAIGKAISWTIDLTDFYTKNEVDTADAQILSDANDYTDIGLALKLNITDYNERYKGTYLTEAALNAAHPTANAGDKAQVNETGSTKTIEYLWDAEDNVWVQGGSGGSGATDTDALPEGSTNLYWTPSRGLALVLSGLSAAAGTFTSSDTLLTAFGKIKYLIDNIATTYQAILVSGSNIKTINGNSILGSGDLSVGGGGGSETTTTIGALIGSADDATPNDSDYVATSLTSGGILKKITWANAKTFLQTTFDNVYQKWILSINPITGITYTIGINDYKIKNVFTNTNPVAFTVPTNASVAVPIGTKFSYTVQGNGTVTVGGAGISFVQKNLVYTTGDTFFLEKIDIDTWVLDGNPAASGAAVPYTAFIQTVTGNNSTAVLGDATKPFLTTDAALAALPTDNGIPWTFQFIDSGVTRTLTTISSTRKILHKCDTTGTFDISAVPGVTDYVSFYFDFPNATIKHTGSTAFITYGTTVANSAFFKIRCKKLWTESTQMYFIPTSLDSVIETEELYVRNSTNIPIVSGTIRIVKFDSTCNQIVSSQSTSSLIDIKIYNYICGVATITINRTLQNFPILNITGTGTIKTTNIAICDVSNITCASTASISISGTTTLKGTKTSAFIGNINIDSQQSTFIIDNFNGRIVPATGSNTYAAAFNISNSRINLAGALIASSAGLAWPSKTSKIENSTFIQDTAGPLFKTFNNATLMTIELCGKNYSNGTLHDGGAAFTVIDKTPNLLS